MSAGPNQFLTLPVPAGNGDGPILDVSDLAASKTIFLSGDFKGLYVVLGSHDNTHFVPVAKFIGGKGPFAIRRDIDATLKSVRVRRQANATVKIDLASQQLT